MELKNKKVLVTGADGFIGSHLVEVLVAMGADVHALSYYNAFNYWGWLEEVERLQDIRVITGDIRDPHFVKKVTQDIDVIFHLAALIAIPFSFIAPESYIETNVKGTLNVCQAALENGCSRVLNTSTSEVYGTARYVPIDEDHPLQPQSPYSASKTGADAIAMSFYHSFDLSLVTARPFNTYGPRQSARAVIPALITQIAAGNKEIQVGSLSPTRDFNYVKDTVRGMILLAECDEAVGQVVNIGTGSEISIKELSEKLKELMNSKAKIRTDEKRIRPGTSEVERLMCDNTAIKKLVGYSPRYTLEKGLQETIEWIEKNLEKYKTDIYNV
jgi:NAD dependent epimerase/dehydratase